MEPPDNSADGIKPASVGSLADLIKEPGGTSVTARVVVPGYPSDQDVTLTVNEGRSHVSNQEFMSAHGRERALLQAQSQIRSFIKTKETNGVGTSRKKEMEALRQHATLLGRSLNDYKLGYNDNTILIEGDGLEEKQKEYATPEQIQARKDLQSDATERVDRAWGLMSEYLANEPDSLDSRDGGSAE